MRLRPLASGRRGPYMKSACTHSSGAKNSNFRFCSACACRWRAARCRPAERTSRDSAELEGVPVIRPSVCSVRSAALAVNPGWFSR